MAIAVIVARLPLTVWFKLITQELSPIRLQVDTWVPEEIVNTVQSFGKVRLLRASPCSPAHLIGGS